HFESAKTMAADDYAGSGAVEVNVARLDLSLSALDVRRAAREKSGRERVISTVCDFNRFIEIAHFQHAQHRAEDFFARDAHVGLYARESCRRNEGAMCRRII